MALHYITDMLNKDATLRYSCSTNKPQSFAERKRLFSEAAQALVSEMLQGEVEIRNDDIQLDAATENIGAIHINERVTRNLAFREMLVDTTCVSRLKTLAKMALYDSSPG
jgi:hypothetical protein